MKVLGKEINDWMDISCKRRKRRMDAVNHNKTTIPHSSVPTLDFSFSSFCLPLFFSIIGMLRKVVRGGKQA